MELLNYAVTMADLMEIFSTNLTDCSCISEKQWHRWQRVFLSLRQMPGYQERAAVLMCIILPANCVTPISPPSFLEWCEVCGSTRSSWSGTILWTSKFTHLSHMVGCGLLGLHHISLDSDSFHVFFLVKDRHTPADTEPIHLTRISTAVVAMCLSGFMRPVPESINFYPPIYLAY